LIIEYEISDATLEENIENLTTHIVGTCADFNQEESNQPIGTIEASLVDVAEACEYDDLPLKEVFWLGSNELRSVYDTCATGKVV
jgi:hypothetical protein